MKWQVILDEIEVMVRVGILPEEQTPQRIVVSVAMDADYKSVPMQIEDCVDYAVVYDYVQSWSTRPHTPLLETLCAELAQHVLNTQPKVSRVRVSVGKPDIFAHARRAAVVLEMAR